MNKIYKKDSLNENKYKTQFELKINKSEIDGLISFNGNINRNYLNQSPSNNLKITNSDMASTSVKK